jgi:hypothetical protein
MAAPAFHPRGGRNAAVAHECIDGCVHPHLPLVEPRHEASELGEDIGLGAGNKAPLGGHERRRAQ